MEKFLEEFLDVQAVEGVVQSLMPKKEPMNVKASWMMMFLLIAIKSSRCNSLKDNLGLKYNQKN